MYIYIFLVIFIKSLFTLAPPGTAVESTSLFGGSLSGGELVFGTEEITRHQWDCQHLWLSITHSHSHTGTLAITHGHTYAVRLQANILASSRKKSSQDIGGSSSLPTRHQMDRSLRTRLKRGDF